MKEGIQTQMLGELEVWMKDGARPRSHPKEKENIVVFGNQEEKYNSFNCICLSVILIMLMFFPLNKY